MYRAVNALRRVLYLQAGAWFVAGAAASASVARERVAGHPSIELCQADAQTHPFAAADFDAQRGGEES